MIEDQGNLLFISFVTVVFHVDEYTCIHIRMLPFVMLIVWLLQLFAYHQDVHGA